MLRALDPYHRIRAAVAGIFVATVAVMALMTVERRPVRRSGADAAPAVVAAPATVSGVGVAGVAVRHPARPRGGSASSAPVSR